MTRVRDVVEVIARELVDHPDNVEITETVRRQGVQVELRVAEGDLGKMVGRQGRTASAVRTLATLAAETEGRQAVVDFVDDDR